MLKKTLNTKLIILLYGVSFICICQFVSQVQLWIRNNNINYKFFEGIKITSNVKTF